MLHKCIKCTKEYQEDDPEPYYCESCLAQKRELATKIDTTFVPRPRVKSLLQEYDEAPKGPGGFMIYRG